MSCYKVRGAIEGAAGGSNDELEIYAMGEPTGAKLVIDLASAQAVQDSPSAVAPSATLAITLGRPSIRYFSNIGGFSSLG